MNVGSGRGSPEQAWSLTLIKRIARVPVAQATALPQVVVCWPPLVPQSRLGEASQPKTRTKLAQLLQHAARGVLGNPTGALGLLCRATLFSQPVHP